MRRIVRMRLQELLLILYCCVQVVKYELQRIMVLYLSSSIGGEDFLHDLIKEVVAEMSQSDSPTLVDQVISHLQKLS